MTRAPDRTILGGEQEKWLARRLVGERRPWTLIAQQVFFAPLWLDSAQTRSFSDQWDGYAANRERVLTGLARPTVRDPVVLSGDVHSFWLNDLNTRANSTIGTEVVTSAIAAASPPQDRFHGVRANNPHVRFDDVEHAGYVLIDIMSNTLTADFRAIGDRTKSDSPVSSLAQFTIEADTAS